MPMRSLTADRIRCLQPRYTICAAAHMLYVQVTPQDVYLEYARAVAQHIRPLPKVSS